MRKLFAAALAASLSVSAGSQARSQEAPGAPSKAGREPGRLQLNAKEVAGPVAGGTNQRLADAVANAINRSPGLKNFRVTVCVMDGEAIVSGTILTRSQQAEVLRLAQTVPGIVRVQDRLQIINGSDVVQTQATPAAASPFQPIPTQDGSGLPKVQPGLGIPGGNPNQPLPPMPPFGAQPNFGGPIPGAGGPPAGFAPGQAPPGFQPGMPQGIGGGPAYGGMPPPAPIQGTPPGFPSATQPPPMPPYAWPTYAPYNNYSRVAYPNLYPYESFPFIGPFYPFPRVPLGWRSVTLSWEDGHWWYGRNATGHDWWRIRYW